MREIHPGRGPTVAEIAQEFLDDSLVSVAQRTKPADLYDSRLLGNLPRNHLPGTFDTDSASLAA